MKKYRIMGIDPGSVNCGWGVIDLLGNELQLVEYGVVRAKLLAENFPDRLNEIYTTLENAIKRTLPDVIVLEEMFYAKNVQSLIKLAHARSAAMLAGVRSGLPVAEYTPTQVKKAVTGRGRGDKEQVQFMVKRLLKIDETPELFDCTDALAVAICHSSQNISLSKKSSSNWSDFIKKNPHLVSK